jgi:hypothetical protein
VDGWSRGRGCRGAVSWRARWASTGTPRSPPTASWRPRDGSRPSRRGGRSCRGISPIAPRGPSPARRRHGWRCPAAQGSTSKRAPRGLPTRPTSGSCRCGAGSRISASSPSTPSGAPTAGRCGRRGGRLSATAIPAGTRGCVRRWRRCCRRRAAWPRTRTTCSSRGARRWRSISWRARCCRRGMSWWSRPSGTARLGGCSRSRARSS